MLPKTKTYKRKPKKMESQWKKLHSKNYDVYYQTKIKWFLFTTKFVPNSFIFSHCYFPFNRTKPSAAVWQCNKNQKIQEKCVENRSIWHANRRSFFLNSMQMLILSLFAFTWFFTMLNSFIVSICWLSVAWSVVQILWNCFCMHILLSARLIGDRVGELFPGPLLFAAKTVT